MGKKQQFASVPADFYLEKSFGGATCRVLMLLLQMQGRKEDCWPSQKYIADRLGVSRSTVKRAISSLRSEGVLAVGQVDRSVGPGNCYSVCGVWKEQGSKMSPVQGSKMSPVKDPSILTEKEKVKTTTGGSSKNREETKKIRSLAVSLTEQFREISTLQRLPDSTIEDFLELMKVWDSWDIRVAIGEVGADADHVALVHHRLRNKFLTTDHKCNVKKEVQDRKNKAFEAEKERSKDYLSPDQVKASFQRARDRKKAVQ